jgi:hypothetical protein
VTKPQSEEDVERYTADVVRFYFPSGTGMTYEVGKDITEADFEYILTTLQEWVYLSRPEFEAITTEKQKAELEAWNKAMEDEEPPLPEVK